MAEVMVMAMAMEATTTLFSYMLASLSLLLFLIYLYIVYWVRPGKALEKLSRQGIRGPNGRRFLTGNLLEMKKICASRKAGILSHRGERRGSMTQCYASSLFPYFDQWRKEYDQVDQRFDQNVEYRIQIDRSIFLTFTCSCKCTGPVFVYSSGNLPSLYVSDPDLVKEISLCMSLKLGKSTRLQKVQEPLFGNGIIKSNGVAWVYQRKIVSPEFFMDKVKGMVELIVEAAMTLVREWDGRVENGGGGSADFMVDQDLRRFSADVISRTCFGSSYSKGEEIFQTLTELQKVFSNPSCLFNIPRLRFLPLKDKREVKKLVNEVRSLILNMVRERKERDQATSLLQKDFLQSILDGSNEFGSATGFGSDDDGFIVDNCKNIYFAGHDTTAVTATWCLMLLASHPEWQSRARAEVTGLCRDGPPDSQILHKLKTLTLVIQETLRLFPPSPFISRESLEDMDFRGLMVPKGTNIWIPITTMHRDKNIWGEDADEFRPERFADGVSSACKSPHSYMPFGIGARKCVGRHLAMVELKILLCLILSKFSFSLSPEYKHSPAFKLTVGPEFGLRLVVKNV